MKNYFRQKFRNTQVAQKIKDNFIEWFFGIIGFIAFALAIYLIYTGLWR